MSAILLTDGYKLDHRRQYPEGTEYVYSNWTPRSCQYFPEAKDGVVVFGIQYFIKEYLLDRMNQEFFNKPKNEAVAYFARRVNTFLGPNQVGTAHIEALHDLGYLPIEIKALPEGTLCPIKVPALTFVNTKPEFFWLTNYFETLISTTLWLPMTSATSARLYKQELLRHARKTGFENQPGLDFLCHDFSMRGMAGIEASIMSGMAHMTSFTGSETIPAIQAVEEYYDANVETELIAGTVPATEHSVMCSNAAVDGDEITQVKRLLTEIYPNNNFSMVSDSYDYWNLVDNILPQCREEIMNHNGCLLVRGDSGDPVQVITETVFHLWDQFGGTVNSKGYKVLDPHVKAIYGDSITPQRCEAIYDILERNGFSIQNVVLGVGSFSFMCLETIDKDADWGYYATHLAAPKPAPKYNPYTRDTFGYAIKATYGEDKDGNPVMIYKQPKALAWKKSQKGCVIVAQDGQSYTDGHTFAEAHGEGVENLLQLVFKDGKMVKQISLAEVRANMYPEGF